VRQPERFWGRRKGSLQGKSSHGEKYRSRAFLSNPHEEDGSEVSFLSQMLSPYPLVGETGGGHFSKKVFRRGVEKHLSVKGNIPRKVLVKPGNTVGDPPRISKREGPLRRERGQSLPGRGEYYPRDKKQYETCSIRCSGRERGRNL